MEKAYNHIVEKLIEDFGQEVTSIFLDAQSELQEQLNGKLLPPPNKIYLISVREKSGKELTVSFIGETSFMNTHAVVHFNGALWEIAIDENGEMNGDLLITHIG